MMKRLIGIFLVLMIACFGAFADGESAEEMFNRGMEYYYQNDYDNAKIWLLKAADNGNVAAMSSLGGLYSDINDYDNAIIWYRKAADNGDVGAMFGLGVLYHDLKDYDNAIVWYRKAADQGHVRAMFNLGVLYENIKDYDNAIVWYRKAADNGNVYAMFYLGAMYDLALEDSVNAMVWYRKAADNGDAGGIRGIAWLVFLSYGETILRNRYDNGKGDKDSGMLLAYYLAGNEKYDEAVPIFTSLSKDFPAAAYWAGYCFEKQGESAIAKYWYNKAESAGFVIPGSK